MRAAQQNSWWLKRTNRNPVKQGKTHENKLQSTTTEQDPVKLGNDRKHRVVASIFKSYRLLAAEHETAAAQYRGPFGVQEQKERDEIKSNSGRCSSLWCHTNASRRIKKQFLSRFFSFPRCYCRSRSILYCSGREVTWLSTRNRRRKRRMQSRTSN